MRIRKFKTTDAKALSELMKKTVFQSNGKDYSRKTVEFLCQEYTPQLLLKYANQALVWVAESGGKLLGTITLDGDRISKMFVLPNCHDKGIGSRLLGHAEKIAKLQGIKMLRVRSSTTAFRFYEKQNFKKTRRISDKSLGAVIWMRKKI